MPVDSAAHLLLWGTLGQLPVAVVGAAGLRYVSDGNPETIAFPRAKQTDLAPDYRSRAKAY